MFVVQKSLRTMTRETLDEGFFFASANRAFAAVLIKKGLAHTHQDRFGPSLLACLASFGKPPSILSFSFPSAGTWFA